MRMREWKMRIPEVMQLPKPHKSNPIEGARMESFSAAQRTNKGGNCVEVFKDPDQIVMAMEEFTYICF